MNISKVDYKLSFTQHLSKSKNKQSKGADCLEAQGRAQVEKKRYFLSEKDGKKVFLKDGKAFDEEGKLFSGSINYKDSKEDDWKIEYEKGRITMSSKNDKPYKIYSYNTDFDDIHSSYFQNHLFDDNTSLKEFDYWKWNYSDINYRNILKLDSEKNQDFVECYDILINKKPKYKNEPILKFWVNGLLSTELRSRLGKEKNEFLTKEDAAKYFKKEYGIDAQFINLKEAHLLKDAIDDFAILDYKEKGKKLFDGLKIGIGKYNHKTIAHMEYWDEKDRDSKINFNKFYNWQNLEVDLKNDYESDFHPTKKVRQYFHHELGHWLHFQNAPKLFDEYSNFSQEEKKIASLVSEYATEDKTEFVAEYIAGRMNGETYPDEVDSLYQKYKGPDLFKN